MQTTQLYPRREVEVSAAFSQDTFNCATANLLSWRQSAGAFGGLHLHACWGNSSTLTRRYHGETIYHLPVIMRGAMRIYERTENVFWRQLVENIVAEILFLQTPKGGFYHASSEYEPTYTCEQSCPIHQGMPIHGLLDYVGWPLANPRWFPVIREAVERHWRWMESYWWKRGSDERGRPLPIAGFCGVTNQDLVIVGMLARYGKAYGDFSRYEKFGRPTLDLLFGPDYYHEEVGLFERSGEGNFVERSAYYEIIVPMFEAIHEVTGDERLPRAADNVVRHLFEALHVGTDGLTHIAWGANLDERDKTSVQSWIKYPYTTSSYPELLVLMEHYLQRHPNAALQSKYNEFERTLAAYVYADGSIPTSLGGDPLFTAIGKPLPLWSYLLKRMGNSLQDPHGAELPVVLRQCSDLQWKADRHAWSLEQNGQRLFAGIKSNPSGIVIGAEEPLVGGRLEVLESPQVHEQVTPLDKEV